MIPQYGVAIGTFKYSGEHLGQWLHALLYLDVAGAQYECAVDVNEPTLGFAYKILNGLDISLFQAIIDRADGFYLLANNSVSGAMDYKRSALLSGSLGCLGIFLQLFNDVFKTNQKVWITVTGTEAGDALIAMVTNAKRVFAFGGHYTDGTNGVHDVHLNQGDPVNSGHYGQNGIWQDGCVFVINQDGTLSAYLGMFLDQTLNTDNNGNPL